MKENADLITLERYYGTGLIFGKMLCLIICVDYILLSFLDFFYPRESIDIAPKFELRKWKEVSNNERGRESRFKKLTINFFCLDVRRGIEQRRGIIDVTIHIILLGVRNASCATLLNLVS